ncbi:flagellar hook-length control protein FliK [Dyella choica]|uniref:Flagellar hook-length control protein FliK n=1 Tax=Dyella choica TaxID=1927959 RepID=A0A432M6T4_9GAMM|nr:flagellar hook-length control protein FliK [Dyella choica]RUL76151.1 flagellar hook-length control protein FliK [Dyella choica]
MSATPLLALPVTPATPSHLAPSTGSRSLHSGGSFHSHLESAQQDQQSSQDAQSTSSNGDQRQSGNNARSDSTPAGDTSSNTSKPGDDAAQNERAPGIDLTGAAGSLAGMVLSLIDHANGDHPGAAPSPAKQGASNKQPAAPLPAASTATMAPVPLPAINPLPLAATGSSAPQTGAALTDAIGSALSTKSSLEWDVKGGDSSAGDATAAGTPVGTDTGSPIQGIADGVQSLAGSAAASAHAALPAGATFTPDTTSGMTALGNLTATPVVPSSNATHSLRVDAPVGSSGFAKELGQQITWLSGQEVKQAQIRLNPQGLGPLDVKVSVDRGRVDVSFMTQHPATTAAVQQGLDQLHQMLGGQGLSLGHATVGQHAQQQFGGRSEQQAQASGNSNDEPADTPVAMAARVAIGLVDAFA